MSSCKILTRKWFPVCKGVASTRQYIGAPKVVHRENTGKNGALKRGDGFNSIAIIKSET